MYLFDTATPDIYSLSLHDALPILRALGFVASDEAELLAVAATIVDAMRPGNDAAEIDWNAQLAQFTETLGKAGDRKSTRLNSSHVEISYAVFCLKKKKTKYTYCSV